MADKSINYPMQVSSGNLIIVIYTFILIALSYITPYLAQRMMGQNDHRFYIDLFIVIFFCIFTLIIIFLWVQACLTRQYFVLNETQIRAYQRTLGITYAKWAVPVKACSLYIDCKSPSFSQMLQNADERAAALHLSPCLYSVYLCQSNKRERLFAFCQESTALHFLGSLQEHYPQLPEINQAGRPLKHTSERFPQRAELRLKWQENLRQAYMFFNIIFLAGIIASGFMVYTYYQDASAHAPHRLYLYGGLCLLSTLLFLTSLTQFIIKTRLHYNKTS